MAGTISSAGLGSGLDVSGIVAKLMAIEQRPLTLLATKEASYQSQISAIGALQGAVSTIQTAAKNMIVGSGVDPLTKFSTLSASVADSSQASAAVSSSAVPGTYSLKVSSLANNQRLQSGNNPTIVDGTLTIQTGTVTGAGANGVGGGGAFTANAGTISITVDASNNTLEGIRDAINAANGNVSATILDDGAGNKKLQLTSNENGVNNVIKVSGDSTDLNYDPSTDTGALTRYQDAADASIELDGTTITSHSNTVTGALDGLTLTLKKADPANPTTITITRDKSALSTLFTALVKAYNDTRTQITASGGYNADTEEGGPLLGDAALRSTDNLLRRAFFNVPAGISGKYTSLSSLGVAVKKDGTLTFDSSKLQTAVNDDFEAVANLTSALGSAINTATTGIVGDDGILASKTDGLNSSIKAIDSRREVIGRHLATVEAMYLKQFNTLDTTISSLQALSNQLTQQLASLSSFTTNKKSS